MDICCPGMWREDEVAARFKVSLRCVRDRARARQVGHKLGRDRWLTEPEILALFNVGPECSYSSRGKARRSGTCEAPSTDKAFIQAQKKRTKRVKDALEIRLARSAGQKCDVVTFREAADLYIEARPHAEEKWLIAIDRLCGTIGDRLLTDMRQAVLIDAANTLYPHCLAATKNKNVFGPCATVLHYAAENDKKLKERRPVPRAMRIGRVFPWRNRAALYRDLRPLCQEAGVAFTPHCARHSCNLALGRWRIHKGDHGGGRLARLSVGSSLYERR
jgi:hypothetical protein